MDSQIKRGQAAIWIILAIVLVASILLFLLLRNKETNLFVPTPSSEFSVDNYLDACVEKEVNRATAIMFAQGGFVTPKDFKLYNKTNIEFICETKSYFERCIQQHPVLIAEMEREILNFISPGVDSCIDQLKEYIERRGGTFDVEPEKSRLKVELDYDVVGVTVEKQATLNYKGEVSSFEKFKIQVLNPAYNLGIVAIEIANQEAQYCYFETTGYTLSQGRYSVIRAITSDQSKIYTIQDKIMKQSMNIAVRSCPLPEGMPG